MVAEVGYVVVFTWGLRDPGKGLGEVGHSGTASTQSA